MDGLYGGNQVVGWGIFVDKVVGVVVEGLIDQLC